MITHSVGWAEGMAVDSGPLEPGQVRIRYIYLVRLCLISNVEILVRIILLVGGLISS